MRKAATALLSGAYLFLGLTLAALFWRAGAGWGAGAAVLIGALGLFFALHTLVAGRLADADLGDQLKRLRQAHLLLADQIEATHSAIEQIAQRVESQTSARTEELASEVHVLEALVERMGEDLDARLATAVAQAPAPAATVVPLRPTAEQQAASLLQSIRDALTENRVDLYLQPVVTLPQRRVMFYEGFSRLRDDTGRVLMPAEYLRVAEPEGLMPAIDNLLLFRAVQIVRKLSKSDRKVGIFCNLSLASLGDESFFPQFLDFLGQNRDLSGALIFELGLGAFRERGATEARNMAKLADLGFRFSIDKVSDLELDFADLSRSDVKFLKIGAEVLLSQLLDSGERSAARRDIHPADFAALTRRYGLEVIAEKVESERQAIDVLELDVSLGQGHLFGEPRAIRESVMAETAPPAEFIQAPLRRRAAGL